MAAEVLLICGAGSEQPRLLEDTMISWRMKSGRGKIGGSVRSVQSSVSQKLSNPQITITEQNALHNL